MGMGKCFAGPAMTAIFQASVLPATVWRERADVHRQRAARHTSPAKMRRDRGQPHPIADFLFQYYPYPFAMLENWHPGVGLALETNSPVLPPQFAEHCYRVADGAIIADPEKLTFKERERLVRMIELLEATRDRIPNFACHGLHEWAMVYRGREIRHEKTLKLRLPQAEIDDLVETRTICCSHHDAFRFFAPEARPMNRLQPDLGSRVLFEQPGCLHANMDLYKWAAKSMPWVGSDLLLDCFELAVELRVLDMRASPYDLRDWGHEPVRIETADGRRIYETEQRRLASLAEPLRQQLIEALHDTLRAAGCEKPSSHALPPEFLA